MTGIEALIYDKVLFHSFQKMSFFQAVSNSRNNKLHFGLILFEITSHQFVL